MQGNNISLKINRKTEIIKTPRVKQIEGIFDVPSMGMSEESWNVNLPLQEKKWNVGLIVGPSGCGKTTILKEIFANGIVDFTWDKNKTIVDGFPKGKSIKEIIRLLCSVGFSSPPMWLRPFHVLSNGQQFRVNLARLLAEEKEILCVDEFTSVVDRTVAKIGSYAFSKTVRKNNQKTVLCSCHYDVIDWLQPDWIYYPHEEKFAWRSLRRRPEIKIDVYKTTRDKWNIFEKHHYLSHSLHRSACCYIGVIDNRPVVFTAVMQQFGFKGVRREHRTVCLPDFQGVGIGNAFSEFIAEEYIKQGYKYKSTTSHPAMIRHRAESKKWKTIGKAKATSTVMGGGAKAKKDRKIEDMRRRKRISYTFEFVGENKRRNE
jgi:ABC-type lipoprotein export system ATPase subunit